MTGLNGITVHDLGRQKSGLVTFTKDGEDPADTAKRMAEHKINISTSGRTSAQLDFGARGLQALSRASVHYFNTEAEIERFCQVLSDA